LNDEEPRELPFVSIVIPVFNDADGLKLSLNSLLNQTYPNENYEIIVVDNGSNDDTLSVIERYSSKYETMVIFESENSEQSSYAARNKGIMAAKGSIICFVDADVTMDEDWLEKTVTSFIKNDSKCLTCKVDLSQTDEKGIWADFNRLTGFPMERYINRDHFAPTCCLLVRRWLLERLGAFDSRLVSGGDLEFGNRVYRSGFKIDYDPNIVVYHPVRSSIGSLVFKSIRIGIGMAQLRKYFPERYTFNPYSIKDFLPSDPLIFKEDLGEDIVSVPRVIVLYMISYVCKLARKVGMIYGVKQLNQAKM